MFAGLVAACSAGLLPAAVPAAVPAAIAAPVPAALTVGTYATSYNAHAINHAVAAPYIASPVIAHAAAAPLAYSSFPAATLIAGRRWKSYRNRVTVRGQCSHRETSGYVPTQWPYQSWNNRLTFDTTIPTTATRSWTSVNVIDPQLQMDADDVSGCFRFRFSLLTFFYYSWSTDLSLAFSFCKKKQ